MEKINARIIGKTDTIISYEIEGRRIDLNRKLVDLYLEKNMYNFNTFVLTTLMAAVEYKMDNEKGFQSNYDYLGKEKCEILMKKMMIEELTDMCCVKPEEIKRRCDGYN